MNAACRPLGLQFRFLLLTLLIPPLGRAQHQGEMLLVQGKLVAITPPPRFEKQPGPEVGIFAPKGMPFDEAPAFIHLGFASVCPKCEFTSLAAFIQDDVQNFKQRFPRGKARLHSKFKRAKSSSPIPIWSFESGEEFNAFERMALVETGVKGQVLLLTLSGRTQKALDQYFPSLLAMLRSYKGVIALQ